MKDEVQKYIKEKITQPKNLNTLKSHYHTMEIILQREYEDKSTNSSSFVWIRWQWVSFIFLPPQ
jgi:hypothetical protein